MIASQQEKVLGVLDLVGEQEADCLKRLPAAIDIVSKEQIVCFRWEPAVLKKTEQISVLPMDVS